MSFSPSSASDDFDAASEKSVNTNNTTLSSDSRRYHESNRGMSIMERKELEELFTENVLAKLVNVARNGLINNNPPETYPEWVPQTGPEAGKYILREKDFWTCGFFPGTLYSLLERGIKFPQKFPSNEESYANISIDKSALRSELLSLCRAWDGPIREMSGRTDTHDMSFIVQPSLRVDYELNGNEHSLECVITAAHALASRYDETVGGIRSWDKLTQNGREITSMTDDFLMIIDGMMNLDLLFYAGHHTSSQKLVDMAITHARTIKRGNLRSEGKVSATSKSPFEGEIYSSFHVVNFSPKTGEVKQKMTAQGYSDSSTWARGQAWGIMGYAQTYVWTKDREFLDIACGMAEYFIQRLEQSPDCVERTGKGRYVALWDFDAPITDENAPLRDSSAGIVAANGMLIMSQALTSLAEDVLARRYLDMAIIIMSDTISFSLAQEKARFVQSPDGNGLEIENEGFDAILKNATANHNARDRHRYWDHGLVYGDYYFVEFGNRLLKMGLV